MVTLSALWLPIVLASVVAMVAGFVLWMVLPYHKGDYRPFPEEGAVADLLRRQSLGPGQYVLPYCADPKQMSEPAMVAKYTRGPVGFLVLASPGPPAMGRSLGLMALYHLVVSLFVGYLAAHTLSVGASYLEVFRVTGTAAFLAYSAALVPGAIWYGRPWGVVVKEMFDGLVWGLLTAGVFGWMWPR